MNQALQIKLLLLLELFNHLTVYLLVLQIRLIHPLMLQISDILLTIATSDTSTPTSMETVSAAPTTVKKYDTAPSSSSALFHFALVKR